MVRQVKIAPFMGSRYVRSGHNASASALRADFQRQMKGLLSNFNSFVGQLDGIIPEILEEAMTPTFEKALSYTPVDSGDLVKSGYLQVESSQRRHQVAIGFGKGNKPDYAIYVHEMPYAHAAPTRSKFLEAALNEDLQSITRALPLRIKEAART